MIQGGWMVMRGVTDGHVSNVVLIPSAGGENPPLKEVVDALDKLLALAKSGVLRGIAWVEVHPDWNTHVDWTESSFSPELMAGITDLQYRFARMRHEQLVERVDTPPNDAG